MTNDLTVSETTVANDISVAGTLTLDGNVIVGGDEAKVAPKDLATWITDRSIQSVDIAASDYLVASVKFDTAAPIQPSRPSSSRSSSRRTSKGQRTLAFVLSWGLEAAPSADGANLVFTVKTPGTSQGFIAIRVW